MTRYRFDDFEFDSVSGRLTASGEARSLRSKSAQLLTALIEDRARVLDREEIQSRLWQNSNINHDNSIEACIRDIRKALCDSASEPAYVKTHPRRGYQFIAAVETAAHETPPLTKGLIRPVGAAFALLLVSIAIATTVTRSSLSLGNVEAGAAPQENEYRQAPLIAVVPSQHSADRSVDIDAVQHAVTSELAGYSPQLLRVLSSETIRRLVRDGSFEPDQLAEYGVTHVLWVSIGQDGTTAINLELVDLSDSSAVMSSRILPDKSADALALEIARSLAATRGFDLPRIEDSLDDFPSEALKLSDRARAAYYLGRYNYFQGEISRAIEQYQQGMAIDPDASVFHSAYAYAIMHQSGREARQLARAAAEKALVLNAANAEALIVLGNLSVTAGDYETAEIHFDSAREIAPGLSQLRHGLAALYIVKDDYDRALAEIQLAETLDPLSAPVIGDSAWFYLIAGNTGESLRRCDQLYDILGRHRRVASCKFKAFLEAGEPDRAAGLLPEMMSLQGAESDQISAIANKPPKDALDAYWQWRLTLLGDWEDYDGNDFAAAGLAYARLGEEEKAASAFREALNRNSAAAPFLLRLKSLAPLREALIAHRKSG